MSIDAAYQFRWGNGVKEDSVGVPDTDADPTQHTFYLSAIYYF